MGLAQLSEGEGWRQAAYGAAEVGEHEIPSLLRKIGWRVVGNLAILENTSMSAIFMTNPEIQILPRTSLRLCQDDIGRQ